MPIDDPFRFLDYRFNKILDVVHNGKAKAVICCDVKKIGDEAFSSRLSKVLGSDIKVGTRKKNVAVSKYGANLIRIINTFLVRRKETYSENTVTRGPYFTWLLLVVTVRKIDNFYSRIFGRKEIINTLTADKIKRLYAADNAKLLEKYNVDLSC